VTSQNADADLLADGIAAIPKPRQPVTSGCETPPSWFTNVRSCVDQRDWERLRRMITNRADQRCEIFRRGQDREARRWLEAHERWAYDDSSKVQVLRRLICLCADCHTTTHFGLARITGKSSEAFKHLCTVTEWPVTQADQHIDAAFALWKTRSTMTWELDLSILSEAGIALTKTPPATERGSGWQNSPPRLTLSAVSS